MIEENNTKNQETQLPLAVWRWLFIVFMAMFLVCWFAFGASNVSRLMVAICIFYMLMYFGGPKIMFGMAEKAGFGVKMPSLQRFLDANMQTYTGLISGREAVLQVFLVPVSLVIAMTLIAIVYVWVTP